MTARAYSDYRPWEDGVFPPLEAIETECRRLFPAGRPRHALPNVQAEGWVGRVVVRPSPEGPPRRAEISLRCGRAGCKLGCIMFEPLRSDSAWEFDHAAQRLFQRARGGGWLAEPIVRCPDHVVMTGG